MQDFIYNVGYYCNFNFTIDNRNYTGHHHYYRKISELTKVTQLTKHVFFVYYTLKYTNVSDIHEIGYIKLKANIDIRTDAYVHYKGKIYKNLEELSKLSIIVENEQLTKTIEQL